MSETLSLRTAGPDDARFVWEVNNHPSVRRQSVRQEPIPWAHHQTWFAERLAQPGRHTLIVEEGERKVGVLRFDPESPSSLTISVAIVPEARGKGLGRRCIAEGARQILQRTSAMRVIAYIRPENASSRRAFQAAGFRYLDEAEQDGVRLHRYVLEHNPAPTVESGS